MPTRFIYPDDLEPEADGGFSVSFPDLPEALTGGDDLADALAEAADCLEEALAGRIVRKEALPPPSPARGRPTVSPGTLMAAKAALYSALRETGTSKTAFAAALGVQEGEVRRMLNPRHATRIDRLDAALAVAGKRLVVTVVAA